MITHEIIQWFKQGYSGGVTMFKEQANKAVTTARSTGHNLCQMFTERVADLKRRYNNA